MRMYKTPATALSLIATFALKSDLAVRLSEGLREEPSIANTARCRKKSSDEPRLLWIAERVVLPCTTRSVYRRCHEGGWRSSVLKEIGLFLGLVVSARCHYGLVRSFRSSHWSLSTRQVSSQAQARGSRMDWRIYLICPRCTVRENLFSPCGNIAVSEQQCCM